MSCEPNQHAHQLKTILSNCHVWGCPVFVLEPKLQKGGIKIPKWAPHSRQGLNMGFSKSHSSSVALIMNLSTKLISAQFHTVFDDCFTTVPNSEGAIDADKWRNIVQCRSARTWHEFNDDVNYELADEWLTPDEAQA